MKKIAIIMGSDSDLPVVEKAFAVLREYGVPFEAHVMSAHRTPEAVASFVGSARENGFGVIIACAGMAAHLAGAIAANTTLPVIGIPCKSSVLDGMDALLSTVMMPTGIPVATVAINGGANAALLAAQILAVEDADLAAKLDKMRADATAEVLKKRIGTAVADIDRGSMEVCGRDLRTGLAVTIEVSSGEVREAIKEPLSEIISMVKMTLEETPPELSADIFDFGIVLVGGGSLLPGIDRAISDRTGIRVLTAKKPMEAVCRGLGKMLQSAGDFSEFVKYKAK